jgi:hypothetical protein
VVAWLAQRVDKTTVTKLLRVSWEAVAKIVIDVVGDVLNDDRFEGLVPLGVDEVSYSKGSSLPHGRGRSRPPRSDRLGGGGQERRHPCGLL